MNKYIIKVFKKNINNNAFSSIQTSNTEKEEILSCYSTLVKSAKFFSSAGVYEEGGIVVDIDYLSNKMAVDAIQKNMSSYVCSVNDINYNFLYISHPINHKSTRFSVRFKLTP